LVIGEGWGGGEKQEDREIDQLQDHFVYYDCHLKLTGIEPLTCAVTNLALGPDFIYELYARVCNHKHGSIIVM
jgi:hypothetical protein